MPVKRNARPIMPAPVPPSAPPSPLPPITDATAAADAIAELSSAVDRIDLAAVGQLAGQVSALTDTVATLSDRLQWLSNNLGDIIRNAMVDAMREAMPRGNHAAEVDAIVASKRVQVSDNSGIW